MISDYPGLGDITDFTDKKARPKVERAGLLDGESTKQHKSENYAGYRQNDGNNQRDEPLASTIIFIAEHSPRHA